MEIQKSGATEIDRRSQRALMWLFLVLANVYAIAFAYLMEFFPPMAASLRADEVVRMYSENNLQFRVGAVLMMLAGGFEIPLAVVITAQMARLEKGFPIWSKVQFMAGTLGTWLFAFPPFLWGVAAFSVDRNPELTVMLNELAWLCFVAPPSYFFLQLVPIGVVAFSKYSDESTAFPRWFGYLTFWMAISGSFGVMAMLFKTGPFAWDGWFSFYLPVVCAMIWFGCLTFSLFRGIRLQS